MQGTIAETEVSARLRVLAIIRAALLASIGIYVALSYVLTPPPGMAPSSLRMLTGALGAVSLGTLGAGAFLRRMLLSDEKIVAGIGRDPTAGPLPDAPSVLAVLARWTTWNIVSWALFESVALYGLVLYMLGASRELFALFAAASILSILLLPPKPGRIRSLLRL